MGGQGKEEDEENWTERLSAHAALSDKLDELLSKQGHWFLQERHPSADFAGLGNQGATCYLNSLIQTLFMTQPFRAAIYDWKYVPETHGAAETCIPYQLQLLFARMQNSRHAVLQTRPLTASFGWTAAAHFQQHDVQELLRLLVDALSLATGSDVVSSLFRGRLTDGIECCTCGFRRERIDAFSDLQVNVAGAPRLEDALAQYVEAEVLDGTNQWVCDRCECKVDAKKGLHLTELPPLLTIQLKRFIFDWQAGRRIKCNDRQSVPCVLNMEPYLSPLTQGEGEGEGDGDGGEVNAPSSPPADCTCMYDLYAILVHSGTAMGGHYRTFIRATPPTAADAHDNSASVLDDWYEFDDERVQKLDPITLQAILGGEVLHQHQHQHQHQQGQCSPKDKEDEMKAFTAMEDVVVVNEGVDQKKEKEGAAEEEVVLASSSGGRGDGGGSSSTTNAYMLMYRRRMRQVRRVDAGEGPVSTTLPATTPPTPVCELIRSEEEDFVALCEAFRTRQALVPLRVHLPAPMGGNISLRLPPSYTLRMATKMARARLDKMLAASAAATSGHEGLLYDACRLRAFNVIRGAPGLTFGGREDETLAALGCGTGKTRDAVDMLLELHVPGDDPFTEFDPSDCHIRVALLPATGCYTASDLAPPDGAVYTSATPLLVDGKQQAKVTDLYTAVRRYLASAAVATGVAAAATTASACTTRKKEETGEEDSTIPVQIGLVHDAYSDTLDLASAPSDALLRDLITGAGPVFVDTDVGDNKVHTVNAAADNSVDGAEEQKPQQQQSSSESPPPPPPLSAALVMLRNARNQITLNYNHPQAPNDFCLKISTDLRHTLAELRIAVAAALDVAPESIHLRRSARAPMLKKEEATLSSTGMTDGGIVFIGSGGVRADGVFKIKFFLLQPDGAFKPLVAPPVKQTMLIGTLKEKVAPRILASMTKKKLDRFGWDGNPHLLRLRDKKGNEAGRVLRDDRTLKQSLLRLQDGREVAVQLLDEPECVRATDILVRVRVWQPLLGKIATERETVLARTMTVPELKTHLAKRFEAQLRAWEEEAEKTMTEAEVRVEVEVAAPEAVNSEESTTTLITNPAAAAAQASSEAAAATTAVRKGEGGSVETQHHQTQLEVHMAKGSAFGPPITAKSAAKLKWNPVQTDAQSIITEAPWNLRDGSLILICAGAEVAILPDGISSLASAAKGKARSARVRPSHMFGPTAPTGLGSNSKSDAGASGGTTVRRAVERGLKINVATPLQMVSDTTQQSAPEVVQEP